MLLGFLFEKCNNFAKKKNCIYFQSFLYFAGENNAPENGQNPLAEGEANPEGEGHDAASDSGASNHSDKNEPMPTLESLEPSNNG